MHAIVLQHTFKEDAIKDQIQYSMSLKTIIHNDYENPNTLYSLTLKSF